MGKCVPISLDKYLNINDDDFKTKFFNEKYKEEYNDLLKYKRYMEESSYQYQYFQCLTNKYNETFKISSAIDIELIIVNILTYNEMKNEPIKSISENNYFLSKTVFKFTF